MIPNGLHPTLSNDAYHADPALGASGISLLRRSAAHFKYSEHKESAAFAFGHAVHTAILEPDKLLERYAVALVKPKFGQKKADKLLALEWENDVYSPWKSEHEHAIVVHQSDLDCYGDIARSANGHPVISYLLQSGRPEVSVFAEHPEYGIRLKCRPDWYPDHVAAIPDIKTTEDARPWAFGASVYRYGYHRAAAHYMDTIRWAELPPVESFFLIAVEKSKPYGICVYELDDGAIAKGREENDEAYRIYAECLRTKTWPGYDQAVQSLSLPGYVR